MLLKNAYYVLSFIIFIHISEMNSVVFSTIKDVEKILKTQEHVIKSVKSSLRNITHCRNRLYIQKFVSQCEKEHSTAMHNVSAYLDNPINMYRMVKRLSLDLLQIENILRNTNYTRHKKLFYPKVKELKNANNLMLVLIYVYGLNVSQFANGALIGRFSKDKKIFEETVSPMTSSDCLELAAAAFLNKKIDMALSFAKMAYQKYPTDCEILCSFSRREVTEFIYQLFSIKGDVYNSKLWLEKRNKYYLEGAEFHNNFKIGNPIKFIQRQLVEAHEQNKGLKPRKSKKMLIAKGLASWHIPEKHLCLGDNTMHKNLYCEYRWGPHPFLRLARLKAELLHQDPQVTMLYDVISDHEIEAIVNLGREELEHLITCDGLYNDFIVRHISCLNDSISKVVKVLSRRALDIGGMSTAAAKKLKSVEYGPAGFQAVHHDTVNPNTYPNQKEHIYPKATVLFYMSNVNQGGATIFTDLNLTVFPVKHAALIFSTTLPSGQLDERSWHGSCPVLHGRKLLAIKWLSDLEVLWKGSITAFEKI